MNYGEFLHFKTITYPSGEEVTKRVYQFENVSDALQFANKYKGSMFSEHQRYYAVI